MKLSKIALLILSCSLFSLPACQTSNQQDAKLAEDVNAVNKDSSLTLNDVTLEHNNKTGQKVWRVQSKKATYSQDKKFVAIESPFGELYQDGKPIYKITGQTGEVQQDGQRIVLRGQIVATDVKDGMVLNGNELEWLPDKDLMIIRYGVTGANQEGYLAAKEGKIISRARKIELFGDVLVNLKDPVMQLKTPNLIWDIPNKKLTSNVPAEIHRYQGKIITDSAFSNKMELNIKTKVATFTQNAKLLQTEPPLQIFSQLMTWDLKTKNLVSPGALTVVNTKEKFTLISSQGVGNLQTQLFTFTGKVVGAGGPKQINLSTDRLIWDAKQQIFQANGNVSYRQMNPELFLVSAQASGKLDGVITTTGDGGGGNVFTSIIPE